MGSSTCHIPERWTQSSIEVPAPGSKWWASDTLGVEILLESCSYGIHCCISVGASVAASKQNWASSIWVLRGEAARIAAGEQNIPAFACCLAAEKSGHVDGYRISDLDCSRRTVTVPGLGGIENPFLRSQRQLHSSTSATSNRRRQQHHIASSAPTG